MNLSKVSYCFDHYCSLGKYLFKVMSKNTRLICQNLHWMRWNSTTKTSEWHHGGVLLSLIFSKRNLAPWPWTHSTRHLTHETSVSIYNFEHVFALFFCLLNSLVPRFSLAIMIPCQVTGLFLYPLKAPENQRFSGVFRGYRKRQMAWNRLMVKKTSTCYIV